MSSYLLRHGRWREVHLLRSMKLLFRATCFMDSQPVSSLSLTLPLLYPCTGWLANQLRMILGVFLVPNFGHEYFGGFVVCALSVVLVVICYRIEKKRGKNNKKTTKKCYCPVESVALFVESSPCQPVLMLSVSNRERVPPMNPGTDGFLCAGLLILDRELCS